MDQFSSDLAETNELARHLLWAPSDPHSDDFWFRFLVLDEDEFSFESNEETTIIVTETETTEGEISESLYESTNENEGELILPEENLNTGSENDEGDGGAVELMETGSVSGESTVTVASVYGDEDCVPLTVEVYETEEQHIPDVSEAVCWTEEDYEFCVAGLSVSILNCESTKRCSNVFVPRVGFRCLCQVETQCTQRS